MYKGFPTNMCHGDKKETGFLERKGGRGPNYLSLAAQAKGEDPGERSKKH